MPQDYAGDVFGADYKKWLREEFAREDESIAMRQTAETAKGKMEYAVMGKGPVVLGLHGMPGRGPPGYESAIRHP